MEYLRFIGIIIGVVVVAKLLGTGVIEEWGSSPATLLQLVANNSYLYPNWGYPYYRYPYYHSTYLYPYYLHRFRRPYRRRFYPRVYY